MTKSEASPKNSRNKIIRQKSCQNQAISTVSENMDKVETSLSEKPPTVSRIAEGIGTYRLEFVTFLMMFSYVLPKITSTSMILDKVCLAHFKYPEKICNNLSEYPSLKPPIVRLATNYQLGHTLIQIAPAALLSCFVGPWSDKYGRKLPVMVAMSGITLDTLISTVCAYFLNSRVEYYFIPALLTGVSGGIVSCLAIVYSYASDLTPVNKRTLRYAFLELAAGLAIPFGAVAGGWIFNFLGYPAVYLISAGGLTVGLFCVVYILPETRGLDKNVSWSKKFTELFSCQTFKSSFIATVKERPHNGRKQIILLIISMCFIVISMNSTVDINFLYVHHQFDWGNTKYSTITAIYSVCAIVLLLIVLPIFKKIKISDAYLGLVGTTSLLIKFIGIGLSYKESIFHIANLFGLLSVCASLAVRSRISKVVSQDDIGKVFSFVATAESLLPVLTTILTSQIFNAFLTIFPGTPYIFLAVFLVIPFSVFIWIACLPNLSYEDMQGKIESQRETYIEIKP